MKRREFVRELIAAKCKPHRQGKKHEIWTNAAGNRMSTVPRHVELRDTLCKAIRAQLGIDE